MKRVAISELETHLRAYLAAVSSGETVVVCDRETPVARIEPIERGDDRVPIQEPAIRDAEERARVRRSIKPGARLSEEDSRKLDSIIEELKADAVIEPTKSIAELRASFDGWDPIELSGDTDPLAILEELREDRT